MPQIMPITALRNTTEISETCHKLSEPIFITKNGYGDMVLMSIETYEKQVAMTDIYQKVADAEAQIRNGEVEDLREVFKKLREEYGI